MNGKIEFPISFSLLKNVFEIFKNGLEGVMQNHKLHLHVCKNMHKFKIIMGPTFYVFGCLGSIVQFYNSSGVEGGYLSMTLQTCVP